MPARTPFNPIEIPNIALNLVLEVLEQSVHSFPPSDAAVGAGVYLLYYSGDHIAYRPMKDINTGASPKLPIYVGKADRKGKRKGFTFEAGQGSEIQSRSRNHVASIEKVDDLNPAEFACRFLSIEDAFIGLAESVLVSIFDPLWNRILDGFGNNPTGGPRSTQAISKWDLFHPGRRRGSGAGKINRNDLEKLVSDYFVNSGTIPEERLMMIRQRIEKYGLG
jgi:hypothetical protein